MANSSALPFPIPSGAERLEFRKGPKTWCKGNGGIRFCGDSCTKSHAYIARLGMRTVKVVPLPGMLST